MSCWCCMRRERLVCAPAMQFSTSDLQQKYRISRRPACCAGLFAHLRIRMAPRECKFFFFFWWHTGTRPKGQKERTYFFYLLAPSTRAHPSSAARAVTLQYPPQPRRVSRIVASPCRYYTRARNVENRESAPRTEDRKSKHFC